MFGLFKKKPPTKAGLAYQRVQAALEPAFKLQALAGAGGADSDWEIKDKVSGKTLFLFAVWGLKGTSSQAFHDDNIDRLQAEAQGLWTGKREAEANKDAVREAVAPYSFERAEWDNRGDDWNIIARFQIELEPDADDLVAELQRFADACRRGFKILESKQRWLW